MPSHILRIIKKENLIQELNDHSVAAKKLKDTQAGVLVLARESKKVSELACSRVSKFST